MLGSLPSLPHGPSCTACLQSALCSPFAMLTAVPCLCCIAVSSFVDLFVLLMYGLRGRLKDNHRFEAVLNRAQIRQVQHKYRGRGRLAHARSLRFLSFLSFFLRLFLPSPLSSPALSLSLFVFLNAPVDEEVRGKKDVHV